MATRKAPPKRKTKAATKGGSKVAAKRSSTGTKRGFSRVRGAEPAPLRFAPQGELAESYRRVLDIAERLPGVEATRAYGTPCIKVDGKIMARLRSGR